MEKSATLDVSPKTDTEHGAAVDFYLGSMKLIQTQMEADRQEIKTLRAETDAIITDIMRTLKAAE